MRGIPRTTWIAVLLWAATTAVALYERPLMPLDETRYAAVAWEMHYTGDYLVPRMNGEVYSHKPPLMFWLINVAWAVLGVHGWAARLVGPAFGLLDLLLVSSLARALWPDDSRTQRWVAPALLASPLFVLYGSLLMFDVMLTFFVLLALLGVARLARGGAAAACTLIALGLGGGILCKGPVVLVYILPAILGAPWCFNIPRWRFALWSMAGVALGAALALAWVVPAAIAGGSEYREAILWSQTAGRIAEEADHARPFWFYLALMPAALFPLVYLAPIQTLASKETWNDAGLRLCAVWFLGGLAALMVISGKQVHYLLPLLPTAALIAVRVIGIHAEFGLRAIFPASIYMLAPLVLFAAAALLPVDVFPQFEAGIGAIVSMTIVIVGSVVMLRRRRPAGQVLWWAAVCSAMFLIGLHAMVGPSLRARYDTGPFAREVARRLASGTPILLRGDYHGEYQFPGRLIQPLVLEKDEPRVPDWCAANPNGYVIWYWRPDEPPYPGKAEFVRPFRGRDAGLVPARVVAAPEGEFGLEEN